MNDALLLHSRHFLNCSNFFNAFNDLFHFFGNFLYLFYFLFNDYKFLNYPFAWDWNLERNDHSLFDLNYPFDFNSVADDFVNKDFFRNFHSQLNNLLSHAINRLYYILILNQCNYLFSNQLHFLDLLDWHMLDNLHLNNFFLDNGYPDFFDYLYYFLDLYYPIHYLLNNLRHLHYLLYYPGHHHYLLNYFLDFHYFGHLHHLFNDLIDVNSNLLDLLNGSGDFDNLLNNYFDWNLLSDVLDNCLWNLHHPFCLHAFLYNLLYLNYLHNLISLWDDLLDDLFDDQYFFLDDRYFNPPLNYLLNLAAEGHHLLHNFLHLFDPIHIDYLLLDAFDFLDNWDFNSNLHDFLNNFYHFLDLFHSLINWHHFLHDSFNYLRNVFDVVVCFSGWPVFDTVHYLLHYFFNLNDHRLLNHSFNYFLDNFLNLFDSFLNFLDHDSFLAYNFNLSDFWDCMVDYLFNDHWLLYFYYFLYDNLNLHNLRYLYSPLHYLFYDFRHLHDLLLHLLNLNYLLNNPVNVFDHFDWNMNNLLNLFHSGISHKFLNYSLDWNNHRHLNHSLNYFLHYFGHLHDFVVDLEASQDIIDIHAIFYLFVDHHNHRFIDLRRNTSLRFHPFELFKQRPQ